MTMEALVTQFLTRALVLAAGVAAMTGCKGESATSPAADCSKLPLAPASARVDLVQPTFSSPLNITNPLFPISRLHSAVLLGTVDGAPLRVETTLLPNPKTITWNGRQVQTHESQYVAFLNGRVDEVALDWYGQADDGSVWYFGEDVFNFENGTLADRDGTWLVERDGPLAMIMPASPKVGDVFRPENICGLVFEEVTVKSVGETVNGPTGPVSGAMIANELHNDGSREDKTFAPGYGEFATGSGGNIEALALAVPTDALTSAPPAALNTLQTGALSIFDAALTGAWPEVTTTLGVMASAWNGYRAGSPPMLATQMTTALAALTSAASSRNAAAARQAAIDVARATLDFRLRHRPPAEIDRARFDLWAAQIIVDAAANNSAGVRGDVTTLEYVRNRFAHTLTSSVRGQLDAILGELRTAADARNVTVAEAAAIRLRATLASV